MLCWIFTHRLGEIVTRQDPSEISRAWIDEWLLSKIMAAGLVDLGLSKENAEKSVLLVRLMTSHANWYERFGKEDKTGASVLQAWLKDPELQGYLQVNRYQDILWFNREAFEELLWWLYTASLVGTPAQTPGDTASRFAIIQRLLEAESKSEYQVEKLLAALHKPR